jgi:MSHA biogenesis protein MshQ
MRATGVNIAAHSGFRVACVLAGMLGASAVSAAPGDTLFTDNLNGNLNKWTVVSSGGDANLDNKTSVQGRSLELRWGTVRVESDNIDASAVAGAQLSAWIRRGSDAFSEDPDTGEDIFVDYRDAGGTWHTLMTYPGEDTPGEIFQPILPLPAAALHANLSVRFRTTGSDGADWDYWHVDDVAVTETGVVVSGFGLDSCEDFETGIGSWSINSSGGAAGTSTQTSQSPSTALYTRGGAVTVRSPVEDLSAAVSVELSLWIRRGSDAFSEDPDNGEDFVVEFLDDGGSWVQLDSFDGNGTAGQSYSLNYALPASALHAGFRVRLRQVNGDSGNWDYWHADDVCLTGTGLSPMLYSFEEAAWSGSGGEVEESGGSGLDGTAIGGAAIGTFSAALTGNPGTCNYGDFDGSNDYIEIADDDAFDLTSALTVAAWINMQTLPSELHTIVSKDTNYEYHVNSSGQVYWWWNDSSGTTRSFATAASITLNQWHHVAITYESGSQVIYIDGVAAANRSWSGSLTTNALPLFIGTDYNFISRAFDGYIDEVYIAAQALSPAEIVALRDATHPCASANAQFSINHDNFGIHCVAETVVVDVLDSVAGTPRLDYNAQVALTTQTGNGSWQLVAGSGSFTDAIGDDGLASYTWPLGESQATFALSYPHGNPVLDIDVYQLSDAGIRDTDAEGQLTFSASGFTVTAAALSNPPPGIPGTFTTAQTAAVPFDLHIAAFGQSPTDPDCGIIESYTGDMPVAFWSTYSNPATGTVAATVDGNPVATSEGSASTQTVTFTNGQAVVSGKYKDVGAIAIAVKDESTTDATQLPVGIRGATGAFVSRPATFTVSDIRDASGSIVNPQAVAADDPVFVAAGAPFRATVTALDAEGDPTPNYGHESIPESARLDVELLAPAGGADPPVSAATGFVAFSGGASTAVDLIWNEVGIMRVRPGVGDADYLGAGDVTGGASENIGRFVPDHFTTLINTPSFATVCSPGGFTYLGERFNYLTAPEITATARAVGGAMTLNYSGVDFFRMDTADLGLRNYTAASGSLDLSGLPIVDDPDVVEDSPGVARITFSSGSGLAFQRSTPVDAFNANVALSIDVFDADGVAASSNPVTFGGGSGIAFTNGAQMRYGRVRFVNAVGSELVNLPVGLFSEYYLDAATGFIRNAEDTCMSGVGVGFTSFTEDLAPGETCVLDAGAPGASGAGCAVAAAPGDQFAQPPAAGSFNLILAAPGAGNSGSVVIEATVPVWLRFDWDTAAAGDEDPSGQATFGLFAGQPRHIYMREIY